VSILPQPPYPHPFHRTEDLFILRPHYVYPLSTTTQAANDPLPDLVAHAHSTLSHMMSFAGFIYPAPYCSYVSLIEVMVTNTLRLSKDMMDGNRLASKNHLIADSSTAYDNSLFSNTNHAPECHRSLLADEVFDPKWYYEGQHIRSEVILTIFIILYALLGTLIKYQVEIYYVQKGYRRPFRNFNEFKKLGFDYTSTFSVGRRALNKIPLGGFILRDVDDSCQNMSGNNSNHNYLASKSGKDDLLDTLVTTPPYRTHMYIITHNNASEKLGMPIFISDQFH
jgi:hypothetical protein